MEIFNPVVAVVGIENFLLDSEEIITEHSETDSWILDSGGTATLLAFLAFLVFLEEDDSTRFFRFKNPLLPSGLWSGSFLLGIELPIWPLFGARGFQLQSS